MGEGRILADKVGDVEKGQIVRDIVSMEGRSIRCPPHPPGHTARLHFPAFLAVRCGHVTEF